MVTVGSGTATAGATATPGAGGEHTLSPAELAAQIEAARALTDDLNASNAGIAAAATKLDRLALEANTLLQQYAVARDAERTAREEANRNVMLYQQLSTRLGEDRRALGQWAYLAYAGTGGSISEMGTLLDTLAKPAAEASDTAAQLSYLSDQRSWQIRRVQSQTQLQRNVAMQAVEASTRATEAAAQAADAKKKLDVVVKEQKAQLDATRQLHAEQVAKAGPVAGLLLGSGDANAREVSKKLRAALVVPGVLADGSVKACSTNEGEYPNGKIPVAGLCPLVGAAGQSLRPGAAAAFNAMSIAYEKDTGSPICVTDSYRSYAEQVSVKAEKGKWAATPGKSEHGMGRAVDLCGGINNFGTPAHLWMKQNAPLYGWFHPDWAEPYGSLPEPWHWEFAG
ncbi:D-alanyl-D-alanine carboxypeptidase [Pedococcus dokdonensis]|uniref:D-alanyl-D-alanine carboxypeptidase n=1 Tax=Pedococcus dokdonensis TaxID=443156 RepID=A0A1H0NQ94_9MICO|nr:M15 family metallopeptidase [Pedococcus dokdonensis]SDO94952.1 D-alanyl-D-alanine carboxypeptidase [Pedococcus dokdonensis]